MKPAPAMPRHKATARHHVMAPTASPPSSSAAADCFINETSISSSLTHCCAACSLNESSNNNAVICAVSMFASEALFSASLALVQLQRSHQVPITLIHHAACFHHHNSYIHIKQTSGKRISSSTYGLSSLSGEKNLAGGGRSQFWRSSAVQ